MRREGLISLDHQIKPILVNISSKIQNSLVDKTFRVPSEGKRLERGLSQEIGPMAHIVVAL